MRDQVHLDVADQVVGADELAQLVPSKVAQVEEAERAEGDSHADRARILGRDITRTRLEPRAGGVRLAGAIKRLRQRRSSCAHHINDDSLERQAVAGTGHDVSSARSGLFICRERLDHVFAGLHGCAVVHEGADRNPPSELRGAAVVILVQVREKKMPKLELVFAYQVQNRRCFPAGIKQSSFARDLIPNQVTIDRDVFARGGDDAQLAPEC